MAVGDKVNFYQRTQSEIDAITDSDANGIYFSTDTKEIFKGETGLPPQKHTGVYIVDSLPTAPVDGKLYMYAESLYIYVSGWVNLTSLISAANGLTATNGTIKLGGAITEDVDISGADTTTHEFFSNNLEWSIWGGWDGIGRDFDVRSFQNMRLYGEGTLYSWMIVANWHRISQAAKEDLLSGAGNTTDGLSKIDYKKTGLQLKFQKDGTQTSYIDLFDNYITLDALNVGLIGNVEANRLRKEYQTLTSSTAVSMDVNSGQNATLALAHNAVITLSNLENGDEGSMIITNTGSFTCTIGNTHTVINGGTLSIGDSETVIWRYVYDGSIVYITAKSDTTTETKVQVKTSAFTANAGIPYRIEGDSLVYVTVSSIGGDRIAIVNASSVKATIDTTVAKNQLDAGDSCVLYYDSDASVWKEYTNRLT